jgi:hypothetical protein
VVHRKEITPVINVDTHRSYQPKAPETPKASTNTQTESDSPINDKTVLESLKIEPKQNSDWKKTLKDHELQEEAAIKGLET